MLTIFETLAFIRRVSMPSDEGGDILVTLATELPGTFMMVDIATVRIELRESENGVLFYASELRPYFQGVVNDLENGRYVVDSPNDVVRTEDTRSAYTLYLTRH